MKMAALETDWQNVPYTPSREDTSIMGHVQRTKTSCRWPKAPARWW